MSQGPGLGLPVSYRKTTPSLYHVDSCVWNMFDVFQKVF